MRNLFKILGITGLLIMFLFFWGCSKKDKVQDKIIGTWEQISVGQIPQNETLRWTFNGGCQFIRQRIVDGNLVQSDTANWDIETKSFARDVFVISGIKTSFNFNGTYRIIKLNDDFFTVERTKQGKVAEGQPEYPYLWLEFARE